MEIGDLVIFKESWDVRHSFDKLGVGIILSRNWNGDWCSWENIVWFHKLQEHVICDEVDLKKVA